MKWTQEMDSLLGTDVDSVIGKKLGFDTDAVWRRRKMLGVAPYSSPKISYKWSKKADACLGKDTIKHTSVRLGVSVSVVIQRMQALGIPALMSAENRKITWPPEMVAHFETDLTNEEIANKLAISTASVAVKRKSYGHSRRQKLLRREIREDIVLFEKYALGTSMKAVAASSDVTISIAQRRIMNLAKMVLENLDGRLQPHLNDIFSECHFSITELRACPDDWIGAANLLADILELGELVKRKPDYFSILVQQ